MLTFYNIYQATTTNPLPSLERQTQAQSKKYCPCLPHSSTLCINVTCNACYSLEILFKCFPNPFRKHGNRTNTPTPASHPPPGPVAPGWGALAYSNLPLRQWTLPMRWCAGGSAADTLSAHSVPGQARPSWTLRQDPTCQINYIN